MHSRVIATLLLFLTGTAVLAADADPVREDEKRLREVGLSTDGEALLQFFRTRTLTDADLSKVPALIQRLGDEAFPVREQASTELVTLGPPVIALLKQALSNPDIEIVRRSERCLEQIESPTMAVVPAAAARLLVKRKPAGAVEVLLAYVPFVTDEPVAEEVRSALAALAVAEGQPDPLLHDALQDKQASRRTAAAVAILKAGAAEHRQAARKLLADADPLVRMRVALALIDRKEKDAIPALVDALAVVPREHSWQAEELLFRIAGEQAPKFVLGTTEAERKQCRDAWAKWWAEHGATIDLAKIDLANRLLGYTLVVERDLRNAANGRVVELGPDKKVRWSIDNLQYPVEAEVVSGDRVLIAEYTQRRVTERNLKGDILWEKRLTTTYPIGCQRLRNGHTFIPCRNQLLEVDATGKDVVTLPINAPIVVSARKLRDGGYAVATSNGANGQFLLLDATGKQVKAFATERLYTGIGYCHLDVLPNGNVLLPHYQANKVVEYNTDGKAVWEATVPMPTAAVRLPNGNTLITSMTQQKVIEVDRTGKEVWEYTAQNRVGMVRRR